MKEHSNAALPNPHSVIGHRQMPYRLRTRADQDRLLIRIYTQAQAFARGSVNRADIDAVAGDVGLYCAARLRSRKSISTSSR